MEISVSAPGKVLLLGEYGVLEGGPALLFAANRRARVKIRSCSTPYCTARNLNQGGDPFPFTLSQSGEVRPWESTQPRADHGLINAVCVSLCEQGLLDTGQLANFDIETDTREFYPPDPNTGGKIPASTHKLGLGSSAALVAAVGTGLCEFSGSGLGDHPQRWCQPLITAHQRFQRGTGSGADVTACLFGGEIEYRMTPSGPLASALQLPPDLHYRFIWTGHGTATGDLLKHLQNWRGENSGRYDALMQELGDLARAGIDSVRANDSRQLLVFAARFTDALRRFADHTGLPIYSKQHLELNKVAKFSGVLYKPCGAGGGDLGVAMALSPEHLDDFVARVSALEYAIISLCPDPQGTQAIRNQ